MAQLPCLQPVPDSADICIGEPLKPEMTLNACITARACSSLLRGHARACSLTCPLPHLPTQAASEARMRKGQIPALLRGPGKLAADSTLSSQVGGGGIGYQA